MSRWRYKGISKTGAPVHGTFSGDREVLARDLRLAGTVITQIEEDKTALGRKPFSFDAFRDGVDQLYFMLASSIPVDRALALIASHVRTTGAEAFWTGTLRALKQGAQISVALEEGGRAAGFYVEPFYRSILAVGEETGELPAAFRRLREHLDFRHQITRDVRSALGYPLFLLAVSCLAVLFIFGFILPRFAGIYQPEELAALPWISQITLGAGAAIGERQDLFVLSVLGGGLLLFLVCRLPQVKLLLVRGVLALPYVREAVLNLELTRLFSALAAMLGSGVELSRSIRQAEGVLTHGGLRTLLEETVEELKAGQRLGQIWQRSSLVPPELVSAVQAGEVGARLPEIFERAAGKCRERFQLVTQGLLRYLEPVIILILGGFVGVIVISIMLAVVGMSDVYG